MPLYDNIADALDLTRDGITHSISLDATGATSENASEDSFYGSGWPGCIFLKVDLTNYLSTVDYDISVSISGANFAPWIEGLEIIDPSFDPNAPDFLKLDFDGGFIGDGTNNPTPSSTTITFEGGRVYYIQVANWNYDPPGSLEFEYLIPEEPICINAVDVFNASSPTASIVSGRVRETYVRVLDFEYNPESQTEAALKFTWSGPAGMYQVLATGRFEDPGGGTNPGSLRAKIQISVNGRAVIPVGRTGATAGGFGADFTWTQYDGLGSPSDGVYEQTDYSQAPWVALKGGDLVEVFVIPFSRDGATFVELPFDIESVCFIPDEDAPASTYCTPGFSPESTPVGDVWGSPNGWGGQMHVPDEIWAEQGITPYDEGDFPWSTNQIDCDFVALEDGTLYWLIHDSQDNGVVAFPFDQKHYIVVKKYDPGTDTWTQIATINAQDPEDGWWAEAVSCHYDGDYVYLVWWEMDTYVAPNQQWLWHCKRLDPSDDSIVELGTGQHSGPTASANGIGNGNAAGICSSGDNVFVSVTAFKPTGAPGGSSDYRLYVWHWDGATWTDLALPDPSVTDGGVFEVVGENGFWDLLGPMVAARDGEGPVSDGFTLVYCYQWDFPLQFALVTIPYTIGSGWGAEIRTGATNDLDGGHFNGFSSDYSRTFLDMDIMWSASLGKLVLAVDFGFVFDEIWSVLKMNDDGDQWVFYNDLAPGSVTGSWRQSRNSAAIGPDGEVYASRWSDSLDVIAFEPKILKTSPGYLAGYAVASAPHIGENATEDGATAWYCYLEATTNARIRIMGNSAYVLSCALAEGYDHTADDILTPYSYGEGFYIFKFAYDPCAPSFRPHIYRRVLG